MLGSKMIRSSGKFSKSAALLAGLIGLGGLAAEQAHAVDARVLPKGRSRVNVIYGQTAGISQTFNNEGKQESVTAPYNFPLSSENIQKLAPEFGQLVTELNAKSNYRYDVRQRGSANHGIVFSSDQNLPRLGDALSRGFLGVGAEAKRSQYNISYQRGLTDRLSLGFMVPYIKMKVDVSHSIDGVNTAGDIYQAFSGFQGTDLAQFASTLDFVRNASDETLQDLLIQKGYNRFGDYNGSGVGDMVLGGRFNYLNKRPASGEWINSVQLGATLPTGKTRHPRDLTAVDFGTGAWDIGAAHLVNYTPHRLVTLSHSFNYTYRLPSTRIMWVRENPDDFIPSSISEENVNVRLGDKYWNTFGLKINFTSAFSIDSNFEWYWKRPDKFSGARPKDYAYMSDKTDAYAETWQIGASINSIDAFLKYKFPLPGELAINYYVPTAGKNFVIAPYGTAELALFF